MLMNFRIRIAASAMMTAVIALGAGCSSGESSTGKAEAESTGQIAAALSGVGPDGATYTLNSIEMNIVPTGDAGAAGSALFFGPGNQSFSVAVGSYAATLLGGPLDGAAGWTLSRQAAVGPTSVAAVLLDPQPYVFTISPGATTNLTLHFEVASVGAITFAAGTLSTNLSVDAGTLPPGHASVVATAGFPQQTIESGSTALDNLLAIPAGGTGSIPFNVAIAFTSPFVFGVDQACANVTATLGATAQPDGGAEDVVYAAFFQEVSGSTGRLCVNDVTSAFGTVIGFVLNRNGTATTPAFQAALGPTTNVTFAISMSLTTLSPFLNNGVLSLNSLGSPASLPVQFLQLSAVPQGTSTPVNAQVQATTPASSTLQVSP
jgi:hypothetical protein